jgi:hypothetical protein
MLVDGRSDGLHDGVEEGKRERLIDGMTVIVDGLSDGNGTEAVGTSIPVLRPPGKPVGCSEGSRDTEGISELQYLRFGYRCFPMLP